MQYIKVSEYAKIMGLTSRTVNRMFHRGDINGIQLNTGTILLEHPNQAITTQNNTDIKVALYARVSSSQNKSNLISQSKRLEQYAIAKGYTIVKNVQEVASGLNDNRHKLNKLLTTDLDTYDILLVEHKDRLTRFGFNHLELLLTKLNKKIEVINITTEDEEDLVQDFVSIITSFCSRIYGQRRSKRNTEKLIEELKQDNS